MQLKILNEFEIHHGFRLKLKSNILDDQRNIPNNKFWSKRPVQNVFDAKESDIKPLIIITKKIIMMIKPGIVEH